MLQRLLGLGVIVITPHDQLQYGADFGPTLQRRAQPAPSGPVLGFGVANVFVIGTNIAVAVQHVQRNAAIVEAIRVHVQVDAVYPQPPCAVVACQGHSRRGQTNIRPMNFD